MHFTPQCCTALFHSAYTEVQCTELYHIALHSTVLQYSRIHCTVFAWHSTVGYLSGTNIGIHTSVELVSQSRSGLSEHPSKSSSLFYITKLEPSQCFSSKKNYQPFELLKTYLFCLQKFICFLSICFFCYISFFWYFYEATQEGYLLFIYCYRVIIKVYKSQTPPISPRKTGLAPNNVITNNIGNLIFTCL